MPEVVNPQLWQNDGEPSLRPQHAPTRYMLLSSMNALVHGVHAQGAFHSFVVGDMCEE